MTNTTTSAPAAWYDDPADPTRLRWWSGTEWTTQTSAKLPAYQPQSAPPSAQTRGVWLIACVPPMSMVVAVIFFAALYATIPVGAFIIAWAVGTGLSWWFGWLDGRELRRRGYRPPSLLWMLLAPPLGYLVARGRIIRAQGGSTWASELVYLGSGFICTLILVAVSALLTGAGQYPSAGAYVPAAGGHEYYAGTYGDDGTPTQASLEELLTSAIASAGVSGIDCSDADVARGAYLTCLGYDARNSYVLDVHICDCGDVYFSYYTRAEDPPPSAEATAPDTEGPHGTGNGIVIAQRNDAGPVIDPRLPWVDETERVLEIFGPYISVGCEPAAAVVGLESTFTCQAFTVPDQTTVDLDVTIDGAGNVSWTEYPWGEAPARTTVNSGSPA